MNTRQYLGDYIQGKFVKRKDASGTIESSNPGDLESPKRLVPFNYEHIHLAVSASQGAFRIWKRQAIEKRLEWLMAYRGRLTETSTEIANQISLETGKPLWEAKEEITSTLLLIDTFTSSVKRFSPETRTDLGEHTTGIVRLIARGVFGVVSPSIQPFLIPHTYFIPALIYGNAVILKGARHAPLSCQFIAECMHNAGIPSGVFNFVQGSAEIARRLVGHPGIDVVCFSGSQETAQKIHKQLGDDLTKSLVLDVSAKNATVIWNDANIEKALRETLYAAFVTAGQRCTSTGRVLVHRKVFDRFVTGLHSLAKKCRIGYGLDPDREAFMGPLISEEAVENYLRYQGIAVREGCEEVMRGKLLEKELKGHYVSPSIHVPGEFDLKSIYQSNEVIGPNVAVYSVENLDDIGRIVRTPGLVSSVYSSRETYLRILDEIQMGLVNWNLPTTEVNYQLSYSGANGTFRPMGVPMASFQCLYPTSTIECEPDSAMRLPDVLPSI